MSFSKTTRLIVAGIILSVILGNAFVFFYIFSKQKNYQQQLIEQQCDVYAASIEQKGNNFLNDLNAVAYYFNLNATFNPKNIEQSKQIEKIKLFYIKHKPLINNILIVDTNLNVFNIYCDPTGNFLIDIYQSKIQTRLFKKEKFVHENKLHKYIVPLFNNNRLIGNIIVTLDFDNFFRQQLLPLYVGSDLFQSIVCTDGQLFTIPVVQVKYDSTYITEIISNINSSSKSDIRSIWFDQNKSTYVITTIPFKFLNEQFIFLNHFKVQNIIRSVIFHGLLVVFFNLILILIIIFYYLKLVQTKTKEENALRESEEAFKGIIESMPIGIIITAKDNRIININRSALQILNIENTEEIIGADISHKFFATKALAFDNEFASVFETDHFIQYENNGKEVVLYKKDIPLRLGGEEIIVQSFIDVTPLEKSRKREIAANMAKSEFLAKMSHEIRTPMNGIVGMADALAEQPLTKEQLELVNVIKKSADLLLSILNDILDLSKIEAGKMVLEEIPFQLRSEMKLVYNLFKVPATDKKLELKFDIADDIPDHLIGDPFRLRQILNNLLNNAIKFTNEGKIHVSVKKLEEYNRNLVLQFKVQDTGIGIPKEKMDKIFQSFVQADNSTTRRYGGTGLGTAIAKQLVELMNGEISVESPSEISTDPQNPGSCFTFTIEIFSNERMAKSVNNDKILHFSEINALIIGENKPEEKFIAETLQHSSIKTNLHTFNKSTFDILRRNALNENISDPIHLLVVRDSITFDSFKFMSRMNELKLVDKYNILIISSNDKQGNYLRARKLGADHYMSMPFETSELFNFICETFPSIKVDEQIDMIKVIDLKPDLKILVAEDNPINQKVAKTLFKNLGYEVDFANNGLEVLQLVEQQKYDIIFMDIMMPEMDGLEATQALRKRGIQIPIIAMTANISKDEKQEALATGMNDYVTKPVKIDTVKKILLKLFSKNLNQ